MSNATHQRRSNQVGWIRRRSVASTIMLASLTILSLGGFVTGMAQAQDVMGPADDPYVPTHTIDKLSALKTGYQSLAAGSSVSPVSINPLQISTIDPSNWPEICAYVEVLDPQGNPVGGLDADSFCVRQDLSDIGSFTVTEIQENCVTSVCLVIDVSGSMSLEGKLDSAKIAAHQFVDQMGVLDRVAIVTFSTCFTVVQDFTSDKALLHSKIDEPYASGYTAAFDGIWKGVDLTSTESNDRAVIALSDGMENRSWECYGPPDGIRWDSWADDSTLIVGLAQSSGVPVYTISLGNTFDPSYLKGIAYGSGGDYYHAPSAGQISAIYSQIKNRLCNRYLICFNSPDPTPDGTCHDVVICRRDAAGSCDHCDTAEWCEPLRPIITLDPLPCQPWNQDVKICATVTDADTPPGDLLVRLYYRNSDAVPFTEAAMVYVGGQFCATIPGSLLPCGGDPVEYYVTASDGTSNVASPPDGPSAPLTLEVCPNHDPVCIVPLDQTFTQCQPEEVCFPISATDVDGNLLGCLVMDPKSGKSLETSDGLEYCLTPIESGTVTISVHCWDDCGGHCYSSFRVTFIIDEPPVLTCPPDYTFNCDAIGDFGEPTVEDENPGTVTLSMDQDSIPGDCAYAYQLRRTWTAVDECGNKSECTQTITVRDVVAPTISGVGEDAEIECPAQPVFSEPTVSDNCDDNPTLTFEDRSEPGSCLGEVLYVRTWTATDECGNTRTASQSIAVLDRTPPNITCPPAITVECVGDIPDPDIGSVEASDDCSGDVEVEWVGDSPPSGSCPATVIRTYRATDACGNATECAQTITIDDTTAPSIRGPGPITVECVRDIPAPDIGLIEASDNCGEPIEIIWVGDSPLSGNCPATVTRTYQATDACGNAAEYEQAITVDDTTPPTITCPGPVTVECIADIPDPDIGSVGASDNCGGTVEITWLGDSPLSGSCPATVTRTYQATDECGNTAECDQTITVDDTTPPSITCPDPVTVECVTDIPDPDISSVVASDNCGGPVEVVWLGDSPLSGVCPATITRTYQATDECGNTAECDQVITVDDTTPPSITCPDPVTVECVTDIPNPDIGSVVASDNCGGPVEVVWLGDSPLSGSCPATVTRTYQATDECGNAAECDQTITIDDTTPPSITCPAPVTVECVGDIPDPDIGLVDASDNCGGRVEIVWLGDSPLSGGCPATVRRTYQATDECGNAATCEQIITVNDETPPTITCPDPITVECEDEIPDPDIGAVTASDNCGGSVEVVWVGDSPIAGSCPGTVTRTYQATDECGNVAECDQTITVDDTTPPSITCPDDITVACFEDIPDPDTEAVTVSDNCGGPVTVTFVGEIPLTDHEFERTYGATDECGNYAECTQIIIVDEGAPFSIRCPDPVTVECLGDVPPPDVNLVIVGGDCGGIATVTHVGDVSDNQSCPETITRTYRATNAAGEVLECTQIITIDDQTPPSITCPDPVTVECVTDIPDPDIGAVEASDNCGGPVEIVWLGDSPLSGSCPATMTRTYQATDECGNTAECDQTITVDDTTPPSITCPGPVTVECVGDIPDPDIGLVEGSDNCGGTVEIAWLGDSPLSGSCPATVTRTYQATDECGNTAECDQIITVDDTTPPSITCPAPVTVECVGDIPDPDIGSVEASDNCGRVEIVWLGDGPLSGSCPATVTRTYQATDECGNTAECDQIITVDDTTPPTVSCPEPILVECVGEIPEPDINLVRASDNCGTVEVVWLGDSPLTGSCPATATRTFQVTDECGNTAECDQTIMVDDITPPVVQCDDDTTVSVGPEDIGAIVEFVSSASDNCQLDSFECDPPSGSFFPLGETTVTCTASDGCNTVECSFLVTVERGVSPPVVHVDLDIKPTSCPNPLNIKMKGGGMVSSAYAGAPSGGSTFPVAILGSADFDVSLIDPSSIRLAGVEPLRWNIEDVAGPVIDGEECECTTAGPDGFLDLSLKFNKNAIIAAIGPVSDGDVIQLTITGYLVDGTPITGTDCVVIRAIRPSYTNVRALTASADGDVVTWNQPNPFNAETVINFALAEPSQVRIVVYDILGHRVATLLDEYREAGESSVVWNGRTSDGQVVASGVYFYRIEAAGTALARKMVLLK